MVISESLKEDNSNLGDSIKVALLTCEYTLYLPLQPTTAHIYGSILYNADVHTQMAPHEDT